jgi:hypothetical protein
MKTLFGYTSSKAFLGTVTVGALALSSHRSKGQTWDTLLQLPQEATCTEAMAVLPDPLSGELSPQRVFVGVENCGSTTNKLVLVNRETGDYQSVAGFSGTSSVQTLGFDPLSRSLYAVTGDSQVLKSGDGSSWWVVDSFADQGSLARGLAVDGQGSVYLVGESTNSHWVVRKGTNQGTNWTTVDDLTSGTARAVHFVAGTNGGLFVAGTQSSKWIVRRSRDAGLTWTTVDSFSGVPNAITSDSLGHIFVAGERTTLPAMRTSKNGGDTWLTVRINPVGADQSIVPYVTGMTVDPLNNLYLVGYWSGWFILRRDASGLWQEFEQPFGAASPMASIAYSIATDPAGDLFVAGSTSPNPVSAVVQQRLGTVPVLRFSLSAQNAIVSWPAAVIGFNLEMTDRLGSTNWSPVSATPSVSGTEQFVTLSSHLGVKFFRLRKP